MTESREHWTTYWDIDKIRVAYRIASSLIDELPKELEAEAHAIAILTDLVRYLVPELAEPFSDRIQ